MTAAEYHADAGIEGDSASRRPSLSSSIAHVLCTQSPRHAWAAHPRLNPNYKRSEDEKFDVGNVAHAMILEGVDIVEAGEYPDWRTNEAKAWRDDVRARGRIPLLAAQYVAVGEMVAALLKQLSEHNAEPQLFTEGRAEVVALWNDDAGVECRARLDWLRDDGQTIDDLKTTSRSAEPQSYARNLFSHGGDIQAAFYVRGIETISNARPRFRWVVVETYPPYALSVIEPAADVLAVGAAKVRFAVAKWAELLELRGEWPAYPNEVVRAELPPWEESRWLDRMEALA